jgi:hypothetical protein
MPFCDENKLITINSQMKLPESKHKSKSFNNKDEFFCKQATVIFNWKEQERNSKTLDSTNSTNNPLGKFPHLSPKGGRAKS